MMSFSKTALTFCIAISMSVAAHAGQITVEAGTAKALKLNARADSIVIGNPNVADVAVHNDQLLFISGKSYGTTNLMIFDVDGNTIHSSNVVVTANTATWVSVNRAGANFTYDCAPRCRPTMSPGDDDDHFGSVAEQVQAQSRLNE